MELLLQLAPNASTIAELVNPANRVVETEVKIAKKAADGLGRKLVIVGASSENEILPAFEELVRQHVGGFVVWLEAFLGSHREQIVTLAQRYSIPGVYPLRGYTVIGGLASCGPNPDDQYHQIGRYAGMILKGAKPANLPVTTPSNFDFVFNLKAAKALGLTVPPSLLATADEVIE
jgi:putative tryptophan/tyrosine transport system substrate-binding protein